MTDTRDAYADAFASWVLATDRDDEVTVPFQSDDAAGVESVPLATITYELSDLSRVLPSDVGTALRLPPAATYAHAARLLWCMRDDESLVVETYDEAVRTLQQLPADRFRRYYDVVDEAVDAVTTTLPTWPGAGPSSDQGDPIGA